MAGTTERGAAAPTRRSGVALLITGIVVVAVGLLGVGVWAVSAWFASSNGTVASESQAGSFAAVGVEDPVDAPEVWSALAGERGPVVWEGTREELDAIMAEGRAMYQENLRSDWLVPSGVIVAVGAAVTAAGLVVRRRQAHAPDGTP